MAPDLNSLPPSSPSARPRIMTSSNGNGDSAIRGESASPSPRASTSLQAAATMNAGLQHEPMRRSSSSSLSRNRQSPQMGRRRSTVLMNLQLNDPSVPGPGEMVTENSGYGAMSPLPMTASPLLAGGDPHHNRAPSLGELHQELEAEQEAQVNRLLQMIRQQQIQLQQIQVAQGQSQTSVAAEDATPTSERSSSVTLPNPAAQPQFPALSTSVPRSPVLSSHPRSSFDMARDALHRRSRTPSRGAPSPRLRSMSISAAESGEPLISGVRDESAYYQAETQSLVRENQMLRHRIRELERQLSEAHAATGLPREPTHHSQLTQSTSVSEEEGAAGSSSAATTSATPDQPAAVSETPKVE
ncbi:hypothetical protein F5Y06DRAFT_266903 [Hypoxylon sp. FL0890]|nr:hypothetical protein F5Y06DRAFT_266903 [Hypoxylon sp. FL0890]